MKAGAALVKQCFPTRSGRCIFCGIRVGQTRGARLAHARTHIDQIHAARRAALTRAATRGGF